MVRAQSLTATPGLNQALPCSLLQSRSLRPHGYLPGWTRRSGTAPSFSRRLGASHVVPGLSWCPHIDGEGGLSLKLCSGPWPRSFYSAERNGEKSCPALPCMGLEPRASRVVSRLRIPPLYLHPGSRPGPSAVHQLPPPRAQDRTPISSHPMCCGGSNPGPRRGHVSTIQKFSGPCWKGRDGRPQALGPHLTLPSPQPAES